VPTAVIQNAVELDLPPTAGCAIQSLPQTVQSTEGHPQQIRYARIREHRRDYSPSLLVVIEVIRLPTGGEVGGAGAGGEGRGGYAEGGCDGGQPDVGCVEIGEGGHATAATVVVIVVGGGAPGT